MSELEIKQADLPDPNQLYNQGKTEITDLRQLKVGEGSSIFFTDREGSRWGHPTFDQAKAYIKVDGSYKFKADDGTVILDSLGGGGDFVNVINNALNTSSKTILSDFTFETTDYAGAFKAGNPTWDTVTGLITGGSGVVMNARGILGANAGVATFTLDATTGNATFAGTLVAASGTLGTITSGTITGATIQTASTGLRARMTSANGIEFLDGNTSKGKILADTAQSIVIQTADNIYFRMGTTTELAQMTSDTLLLPNATKLIFSAGATIRYTGGFLKFEGASGGAVGAKFEGTIYPNTDADYDLGDASHRWRKGYFDQFQTDDAFIDSTFTVRGVPVGSSANNDTYSFVTNIRSQTTQGRLEKKFRTIHLNLGVITSVDGESGWVDCGPMNP